MKLGAFSVSLNVCDIAVSRAFYADLGFSEVGGDATQGWLIMRNGDGVVGLFQGMIEKNTLTFNPGWDQQGGAVEGFEDVRGIQDKLKAAGHVLESEADPQGSGPGSFLVIDPDGNPILVDQHV